LKTGKSSNNKYKVSLPNPRNREMVTLGRHTLRLTSDSSTLSFPQYHGYFSHGHYLPELCVGDSHLIHKVKNDQEGKFFPLYSEVEAKF
jgi:hypothetical protein